MSPSQEVVQRTPVQQLVSQIRSEQFQQQIGLALPSTVARGRFVRATVTALMANPDLATADPDSVFTAAIRCAQDGLLPDGREAAFVMFKDKAAYLPMVGGFRKIAGEHGWTIRSAVVYAADEFSYELGLEPTLTHRPAPLRTERGEKIAAYAVGSHKDGRREFEVMTAAEIAKVRAVSRASGKGPWVDWEERMWEKTPARRLFAKLPLDRREDSRIDSILQAARDEGPNGAADLLYGPDEAARRVTPALPLPADTPTDATSPVGDESGGQQADPAVPNAAAGSAPDLGENEPPVGPFQIPAAAVDDAAATVVPAKGSLAVKGKPLATIAAEEGGLDWIGWALRRPAGYWPEEFRAVLDIFVEHRCPDVWAAWQADQGEAA